MKSMFDPLVIGSLRAKNSIIRAATAESLAMPTGSPTSELFEKYEELAKGGVGTIITGFMFVTPDGKPAQGALGLYDDSYAQDYKELTSLVHSHGACIVAQLVYGGSKSHVALDDARRLAPATETPADWIPNVNILGPSALENPRTHLVPVEATAADLKRVIEAFGSAAARAEAFGFDGVEIHAAHGYLLSQFLSRRFNVRDDEYGGYLENRARLTIECVKAARKQTSNDFPILVKMNSCDDLEDPSGVHGGLNEDESAQVCQWLVEAGATAIDVSGDWHAVRADEITGQPFFARFGKRLARILGVSVIVTGGWRSVDTIEKHLAEDDIAAIAMSRPLICEPNLVARWLSGYTEPSRCTSCGYCAKHAGIPCALNQ